MLSTSPFIGARSPMQRNTVTPPTVSKSLPKTVHFYIPWVHPYRRYSTAFFFSFHSCCLPGDHSFLSQIHRSIEHRPLRSCKGLVTRFVCHSFPLPEKYRCPEQKNPATTVFLSLLDQGISFLSCAAERRLNTFISARSLQHSSKGTPP